MPRVFSSVKEVWQGVLSGEIVPTQHHAPSSRSQRRRVSCSNIQTPLARGCLRGSGSTATPAGSSGLSQHTQCTSDTDGTGSTNLMDIDENFECSVSVRLEDNENNDKSYDISMLSDADLRRLKHEDPFLYYSIPSIRRRSYRLDDPGGYPHEQDAAAGGGGARRNNSWARRSSLPAAILANAETSRSSRQLQVEFNDQEDKQDVTMIEQQVPLDDRDSVVRRNRRLSTEAHPTLICDSLLRELQELEGDNSFIDDDLALLGQEFDDDTFQ